MVTIMSATQTNFSDKNFQDRIARIEHNKPKIERRKSLRTKAREKGRNALYPLSFVGAFLLGMIIVFIVRFVRFQMSSPEAYTGDVFVLDALFAGMGVWVFAMMFKLKDPLLKSAQGFGTTAMLVLMHNLAFWAPQSMALLFSPHWVEAQVEWAEPNSIRVMDHYIPFRDPDSGNALPKVTYRS